MSCLPIPNKNRVRHSTYGQGIEFTDEKKDLIYEKLLAGNPYTDALRLAKIPEEMGKSWRNRGRKELEAYAGLCERWDGDIDTVPVLGVWGLFEQCCQWAEAGYRENLYTRAVGLADKGQWGMEMRLIEARHRKEFGRAATVNVNQKVTSTATTVQKVVMVVVDKADWKEGKLHSGEITQSLLPPADSETDSDTVDTTFAEPTA